MYSQKSVKIAENCRFCWMCRHVCPVGLVTGQEKNTPRAKGLYVAMEQRGFPMDRAAAKTMYECMLCGSCSNDCATGFEPPVFIREARTRAAVMDLLPAGVSRLVERILETGVMYERAETMEGAETTIGEETAEREETSAGAETSAGTETSAGAEISVGAVSEAELRNKIETHRKKEKVLLILGAAARYRSPEMAVDFIKLLEAAGVLFTVLSEEKASGYELYDLLGAVDETRSQAAAFSDQIAETGAETAVVLDPYIAETLLHQYPVWGCALNARVVTATSFLNGLVKETRLAPRPLGLTVTLHDSERLARDLSETESARELLRAAGCEIREMFLNKKLTRSCGNELFAQYEPEIAEMTGKARWEDAKRTGAEILAAEGPQSYAILKRTGGGEMKLADVFGLMASACGI